MNEIKSLRKDADLTQREAADLLNINKNTLASYEQGRRKPSYDVMDKIRRVLGSGDTAPTGSGMPDHARRVRLRHAGAGPGRSTDATEEVILDERLFAGSGIDFDDHEFIRVKGSSMEPILSHGQVVFVEPVDRVQGSDIYVYWRGDERGYVVAIIENTRAGLHIEKRGPSPTSTEWEHQKGDLYESENGEQVRLSIWGRVLGSFGRPAQQIAAQNEAARHAALAMQQ